MGYRDDFYVEENIIGHTGNLFQNPTVYFCACITPTENTKIAKHIAFEFGHITQQYPDIRNVGREYVRTTFGYCIQNGFRQAFNGSTSFIKEAQESFSIYYCDGSMKIRVLHFSRNDFHRSSHAEKQILAESIKKFTEQKLINLMYDHSDYLDVRCVCGDGDCCFGNF